MLGYYGGLDMAANLNEQRDAVLKLLAGHGQRTMQFLCDFLHRDRGLPPRLLEAIEYSVLAGGNRLRPTLVMECFRACSACGLLPACASAPSSSKNSMRAEARTPVEQASALASAAAMELIHTFSLVHDDLPAMDDDDLRRGRPTNHKVFGEAIAILAGDAMTTLAFEIIATDAEPDLVAPLVRELARARVLWHDRRAGAGYGRRKAVARS